MSRLSSAISTLICRLKELELWELYCDMEVKIIPLLAGMGRPQFSTLLYYLCVVMQNTGIQLDITKLLKYSDILKVCG